MHTAVSLGETAQDEYESYFLEKRIREIMKEQKNLKGKVALITGGATGIGRCCAERMAALGASVAVNYCHSREKAEQLAEQLNASGAPAMSVKADVVQDGEIREMVDAVIKRFGRIDVLINNAGRTRYIEMDDLEGVTEEDWDMIMNTNVRGAFYVTRACAEELKKNSGCVVNISSITGFIGQGSSIPYAVSKAGLINLTKCLARALAPTVRVNSVAPGVVMTDWVAGQEKHIQRQSQGTLMGRVAEADEVADLIEGFVMHGGFVNGQTLIIDGGFYL